MADTTNDTDNKPASARPVADENGRTVELHYSPGHIARLKELKRQGKKIKLPPGVTLDDAPGTAPGTDDSTARG